MPSYVDPGSSAPPGSANGVTRIAAGNMIVEAFMSFRNEIEDPFVGSIHFQKLNVVISPPDSTQPLSFATKEFRETGLRFKVAEMPGIGFAVLLLGEDIDLAEGETIFTMNMARVLAYDFDGNLLGSRNLPDILGQPTISPLDFKVLADPAHKVLRFLVGYQEVGQRGSPNGPPTGQVIVITPDRGPLGTGGTITGTDYGEYLSGPGKDDTINAGDGNDVIDGYAGMTLSTVKQETT